MITSSMLTKLVDMFHVSYWIGLLEQDMKRSPVLPRKHPRHLGLQHTISELKTGKWTQCVVPLLNNCEREKIRSYQVVLEKNNYTRNLLHPPWKYVLEDNTKYTWHKNPALSPLSVSGRSRLSRWPPPVELIRLLKSRLPLTQQEYSGQMIMTSCQDHIPTENRWFVICMVLNIIQWTLSGDVTMRDTQPNEQGKIGLSEQLPCLQIGCATAWRSSKLLRSMETSPFHKLWHSLNVKINNS